MYTATSKHSAFILIELLLVLTIIGILSSIGWIIYLRGVKQSEVRQVSTQLTSELRQARSNSQKTGADYEFSWTLNTTSTPKTIKSYTVKNMFTNHKKTIDLDEKTLVTCISDCSTSLIYRAPFGEIDAIGPVFQIQSRFAGIAKKTVKVYGVTGKVEGGF